MSFGQETLIFGVIRDIDSQKPIEYATVLLKGTNKYTETDDNGKYKIVVPFDTKIELEFRRIGYIEHTVSIEPIKAGQKRNINLKLVPRSSNIEVVIRSAKIDDVGMVREEVSEFKVLPSASGNFESILPHIALGVNTGAGGELTSQYNVRGGNYDENLIYVNDFEIFRPQLIRSGQQEGLSFPNIDLIRDLEFSSGGFESRYGDKMSSVLDIRYKRPEELRGSITGSLLGASTHFEGSRRIGKNAYNKLRFLMGLRYKTNAYLLSSSQIKGEYVPNFFDIQSYVTYDLTRNLQLGWVSNYNSSNYNFEPVSGKSKSGTFDFQLELQTNFEGKETNLFKYGMTGLSLTYLPDRNKNPLFMKWLISTYKGQEAERFDIIGKYQLAQIESALGNQTGQVVGVLGSGVQHGYARNFLENTISNFEYKGGYEWSPNVSEIWHINHFITWGSKYQYEFFNDRLNEWNRLDSAGYTLPFSETEIDLYNFINTKNIVFNNRIQSYVQNSTTISNDKHQFKLVYGIRHTYRTINNESFFSPRIQIMYKPMLWKKNISFKVASGLYNQVPFYREYRRPDGTINYDLKSQKSIHLLGGMAYDFYWERVSNRPFKLISEVYIKNMKDLVSYEYDNVRIRYAGENNATGYVVGWDLRLNGEFVPNAESWLSFSLIRAREQLNGITHLRSRIENQEYVAYSVPYVPRPTDNIFAVNMFFQDYLPKNENITLNLNLSFGGGLPFGPPKNNLEYRNVFRMKGYKRVDIGMGYQLWKNEWRTKKKHSYFMFSQNTWLGLEIFNLLAVKNQASINWVNTIYNVEYALPNNLTGRRINLRLRVDF